jgi:cob(I)alamin adenosyltransferase
MAKLSAKLARKGLTMFYYGKGKGKTTALMGLAARAVGAGMNVYIMQFVKAKAPKKDQKRQSGEWPISSEILFFDKAKELSGKEIGKIVSEQVGLGFVGILGDKKEKKAHVTAAKEGLKKAQKILQSAKYDLVILDELVSAVELKLISEVEAVKLIKSKPKHIHLAYSGHDEFKKILEVSDLASEINMIKHPYYKGILAQRGIDF